MSKTPNPPTSIPTIQNMTAVPKLQHTNTHIIRSMIKVPRLRTNTLTTLNTTQTLVALTNTPITPSTTSATIKLRITEDISNIRMVKILNRIMNNKSNYVSHSINPISRITTKNMHPQKAFWKVITAILDTIKF